MGTVKQSKGQRYQAPNSSSSLGNDVEIAQSRPKKASLSLGQCPLL